MAKTRRKNKKYSPEFKLSVILDMREHHLWYRETEESIYVQRDRKAIT